MKYANIKNDVVDVISYVPQPNFIEVHDDVFAGYLCLPDGSFSPPTMTLEDCKAKKMDAIKSKFNSEYYGGFHSNDVFYSSDDANRYRITKAKANSGGLVMNGGDIVMLDAATSNQVDTDMNAHLDDLDARFYAAQNEVAAATTREEVDAVVL